MIASRLIAALLLAGAAGAQAQYAAYPPPPYDARDGYDARYRDGERVESVEVFYEPLSHYGRWVETRWGRAWQPAVDREWRPFTVGHWEDTAEFGRTWRSDEPWGWATYHYGRWGFDDRFGWVWVPDTIWGPGWVAWREGGDYAGWAPLPPRLEVGFGIGAFADYGYEQWYAPSWVYVPRTYVYSRSVRTIILPPSRNRDWWQRTRDVTHYERSGDRVVNRSFAPDRDHRGDGDRRGYDGDRRGYDAQRGFGDPRRADGQRPDQQRPDQRRPDQQRADQQRGFDQPRGAYDARGGDPRADGGRRGYGNSPGWQRPSAGPAQVQVQSAPGAPVPANLNRPPDPNATRPYWEQRRAQAFQPATGAPAAPPPGVPPVDRAQFDRGGERGGNRGAQVPSASVPQGDRQRPDRGAERGFERGGDRGGYVLRGAPAGGPPVTARPQIQAAPAAVARPQVQAPPAPAAPPAARPAPPPPPAAPPPRAARDDNPRRSNN